MARVRDEVVETAKPKSDAYVGLLAISLGAMIVGCVLLFMDYSQYPDKAPPKAAAPVTPQSIGGNQPQTPPTGGAQPPG